LFGKCKKWGKNWLHRYAEPVRPSCYKKNSTREDWETCAEEAEARNQRIKDEVPQKPYELDYAVEFVLFNALDLYKHHISQFVGRYANRYIDLSQNYDCFSENDRKKRERFVKEITHRCYDWGE